MKEALDLFKRSTKQRFGVSLDFDDIIRSKAPTKISELFGDLARVVDRIVGEFSRSKVDNGRTVVTAHRSDSEWNGRIPIPTNRCFYIFFNGVHHLSDLDPTLLNYVLNLSKVS